MPVRVLLVEDDEDDYVLIKELLVDSQRVKFDVTWVDSYQEANAAFNTGNFDVCLVDYHLGKHNGSELIQAIAASNPHHPPMIMLTGQGGSSRDLEALAAGAVDYLEKDRVDALLLERTIRYAIERHLAMQALRARENELRIIAEQIDDGMVVINTKHIILFINPAAQQMLGKKEGEKLPEILRFPYYESNNDIVLPQGNKTLLLDIHRSEAKWHGQQVYILALHDISKHRQAEQALKISQERYELAASGANDGLWDWDLINNQVYFSPRWWEMIGKNKSNEFDEPQAWFDRVHPDDLAGLKEKIELHLSNHTPYLKHTYRLLHTDGNFRWVLCRGRAVRDLQDNPYRFAGSQTDVTKQKEVEAQLKHDALHDKLTGLPNQTLFVDRLEMLLNKFFRQPETNCAVLFLDLDDFKVVNDSLGHVMGDRLLVKVARRLKDCLRPGDTVSRLGGDEFAILLNYLAKKEDNTLVANRIKAALSKPFNFEGQEVNISCSIGIVMITDEYRRAEDLLRDADTAMYCAKQNGKNSHAIFSLDMHQAAVKRLHIDNELRYAITHQQLLPYLQPIVSIDTGDIIGFESLVRWQHPERGLVSPADFIPISEQTGLIIPIGELILEQVCAYLQNWNQETGKKYNFYISVNLSPRQMAMPELGVRVKQIIKEYGLRPEQLRFEITETALIENAENGVLLLNELRSLGHKIYLDDFGTGYSSLSYLHDFPIDVLKIDRSFIQQLDNKNSIEKPKQIIAAILNLAETLDMEVIAEGVETKMQLEILKSMGCNYAQGFYYAKPMAPEAALKLLGQNLNN